MSAETAVPDEVLERFQLGIVITTGLSVAGLVTEEEAQVIRFGMAAGIEEAVRAIKLRRIGAILEALRAAPAAAEPKHSE